MASPEISGNSPKDVEVWARLQIARSRRNVCEVIEGPRWRRRPIVKESLGDKLTPSEAAVRDKKCSLRFLGIGREICNSGADLFESGRRVRDPPPLGWEIQRKLSANSAIRTHISVCGNVVIVKSVTIPWKG